jgi:hypothetical protein
MVMSQITQAKGRSVSVGGRLPSNGLEPQSRDRFISNNLVQGQSALVIIDTLHLNLLQSNNARITSSSSTCSLSEWSASTARPARTSRSYSDPDTVRYSSIAGRQGSNASLTNTSVKVFLYKDIQAIAIADLNLQSNFISTRIIQRIKDKAAQTLKLQQSLTKSRVTFDGVELGLTGEFIDLTCSADQLPSACCHRFYITRDVPPKFDILLGHCVPCIDEEPRKAS